MYENEVSALLRDAASMLGARMIDCDQHACRFDLGDSEFTFQLCSGEAGDYLIGSVSLCHVSPEQNATQLLFGLYANAELFALCKFPVWCGMNAQEDLFCCFFSCSVEGLFVEKLVAIVAAVVKLKTTRSLDIMY